MTLKEEKRTFEREGRIYESAVLTFHGVEGYDVYNCSIPYVRDGKTYLFGRVERREEWATSWVRLFEQTGPDDWTLVPDSMIYTLEDPYVQFFGPQLVLGGTHVQKEAGEVKTYFGYFFRGTELENLRYFTTGPDKMKDIRLVPLQDGRIGVFSRPRGAEVEKQYGSGAVIGFAVIRDLNELTADLIARAPVIGNLFGAGEWGGCNQCYLLKDGRIGVIGHRSYKQLDSDGLELQSYVNISFIFDYKTFAVSDLKIIGDKPSYPDTEHMLDYLKDCAFTSGIVMHEDGRADLYSGLGDVTEGRITIDAPFGELL